ncbi:lymphocyte antigen 6K isoform X1 [Odocoileus virginianus]|uniref:Lymphocyte antigen 6K isoform X1 n=1 Tax=Odocoileus virginianus TaxID=9874 RepID=A0ABM4IYT9_ODOVR
MSPNTFGRRPPPGSLTRPPLGVLPPASAAKPSGSRAKPDGRGRSVLPGGVWAPSRSGLSSLTCSFLWEPLWSSCPGSFQKASLEMITLLAFLLVLGLPRVESNVTVPANQGSTLRCHVCERENSVECQAPENCDTGSTYCISAAVRIFPRYFLNSKQCAVNCGLYETLSRMARSFVLIKPTPFLFLACCTSNLCNVQKPVIKENTEDAYLNPGMGRGRGRSAAPMPFLILASALLGLRLP